MGAFITNLIEFTLLAVWLLVLGRVLISWVDPVGRTTIGRFLVSTTEPLLAPIRRALPRTGMFDLAPLVVLIVLSILFRLL